MTMLKSPFLTMMNPFSSNGQKKTTKIARFIAILTLAFTVFGVAGFTNSGTAFAKTTTACGDQTVASSQFFEYSHGTSDGVLNLVKDTCTNLFHAQVVCTLPDASVDFFIDIIYTLGKNAEFNEVLQTCSQIGDTFNTAPMAYQKSLYFCAWGFGSNPEDGDGGNTNACVSAA